MKPLQILKKAAELQTKKGNDYQSPASSVVQADYYPHGVNTIMDQMLGKILRMRSILDTMEKDHDHSYSENFEALEDSTVELVQKSLIDTGMKKIALAGGVCGNVRLNQKISEIEGVEEVFIHPNMGDGGCALGGALHYFSNGLKNKGEAFGAIIGK